VKRIEGGKIMLDPIVLAQLVLVVVIGEILFNSIKPVAIFTKKLVKAAARRLAD
jgi:hypothetical protein